MSFAYPPESLLASETARRQSTDYRFEWGSYIGWTILTLGTYSHYGTYRLVQRRYEHGRRRLAFAAALWHTLAQRADAAGRRAGAQPGLDNLSRIHAQLDTYERTNKRNPGVWLALRIFIGVGPSAVSRAFLNFNTDTAGLSHEAALIAGGIALAVGFLGGLVGAYVNHFLNKDIRFLHEWERSMFEQAAWTMRSIGIESRAPAAAPEIPERNTALYAFLTVITLGIFAIAWRYFTMKDGNEHFDADEAAEDSLLAALGIRYDALGPPLPPMPHS